MLSILDSVFSVFEKCPDCPHFKHLCFFAPGPLASFDPEHWIVHSHFWIYSSSPHDTHDHTRSSHYLKLFSSSSQLAWLCDQVKSSLQIESSSGHRSSLTSLLALETSWLLESSLHHEIFIAVRQPIDRESIEKGVLDCFYSFAQPRHQYLTANKVVFQVLLCS